MTEQYAVRYPRRVLVRAALRLLGRVLLRLFMRPEVHGLENLPKQGPVILVGNHVAIIEIAMMAVYVPWPVEFIATGDIPINPSFQRLVDLWQVIPVNRGSTSRQEMKPAMDVLRQNGAVGIFPEGGIWSTSMKQARTGVAWLSYHTNAPVLPMGFGGMRGALQAAMSFKRPRVIMNVGQLMPPVSGTVAGKSRKAALEDAANEIMAQVAALIPEEEKQGWNKIQDERFDFQLLLRTPQGEVEQPVAHPAGLGRFFHMPVILDVMARNMKLPVQALQQLSEDPHAVADAASTALSFFDTHPQFLSYRLGYREAQEVYEGVVELRDVARQAGAAGSQLVLRPIRQYRNGETGEEVIETSLRAMHEM